MNIITIDLGGTNTRIARAIGLDRCEFTSTPVLRKNTHDYEDDLAFIVDSTKELSQGEAIDAVGIGVPGRVNENKTNMVASYNLPEWANRDFCKKLASALHCPVYMDNDAVAASLGEAYYGGLQTDFHYLIWGTGISGVSVTYDSSHATAIYIRPDYRAIFDAWENDCGGAGILRKYGKPGELLTAKEWEGINERFASYLQQYIVASKPPAIVFGGGLAIYHAKTISEHTEEMGIPIKITQFGENGGLVGGLGVIRRNIVSAS